MIDRKKNQDKQYKNIQTKHALFNSTRELRVNGLGITGHHDRINNADTDEPRLLHYGPDTVTHLLCVAG